MKKFVASTIKCYEEDGVLIVALGDDPENPANFIIITRLDDEDNATVNDGIGFQTHQSEYEISNAIAKVSLHSDSLEVTVKPEFIDFFGSSSFLAEIPQGSNDSSTQFSALKDALQTIFNGAEVELVI
ncbi:hypothetical protein KDX30_18270 [Pseudomonas sp. CDFA 553]|uniref:hypothetical protein n=1 Tax=Pseudomonas quasicaspiana TaxID=2829821 RepID=UPI001E3AD122|nr:hypothetical protein [Pseudomonas quasicaspiana]MCD5989843.1 hypothetical protein [Pseudomonas quasicaspiana]